MYRPIRDKLGQKKCLLVLDFGEKLLKVRLNCVQSRVATQGSDPGTAAEGYSRSGLLCSDQFKISLMLSLVSELCPPCLDRGGGDTANAHGPVVCTGAVTRHQG